jgi:hypothetical protein
MVAEDTGDSFMELALVFTGHIVVVAKVRKTKQCEQYDPAGYH